MNQEQIIYQNMRNHNQILSEFACRDEDAIRIILESEDIRPAFFRDIDRIIYSMSYTRYMDKTQVFIYKDNDHISKRMIHVQLVSKIARTIGRALSLNEDLIEAAALGHDLGHVPFGHVGESLLNQISLEEGEGYFNHNIQSVRLLMNVEHGGKGSNVTLQVLDAIMCHNGEFVCQKYTPKKKSKENFLEEYNASYQDKERLKHFVPMTLEGCVVRISDIVAYLGRDINDACALGVFKKEEIPKEIVDVLGFHNHQIINTIIMDVIHHSIGKPYISMSSEVFNAILSLKKFNMEHIYMKAHTEEGLKDYENMFRTVFDCCKKEVQIQNKQSLIYCDFLNHKGKDYQQNNSISRIVIDYIAGMTDDYLKKVYSSYKN